MNCSIFLRPAPALAALCLLAAPVAVHAAPPPTMLVAPFDTPDRDIGYIAMLRTIGALRARGDLNVVHPKVYTTAVQVREGQLRGTMPAQLLSNVSQNVGATYIVSGKITQTGKNVGITIDVRPVKGGKTGSINIEPSDVMTALDKLPLKLALAMNRAEVPLVIVELMPERVTPVTKNLRAMIAYAACHRGLMRQPVGIRQPVVLDKAHLDKTIEDCEAAKKLDPKMPDPRAALGFAYALAGERKKAELHLSSVRKSKAFLPHYYVGKFWVLSRYYSTDAALQTLLGAVEVNPGFLLGRGYLGDALGALGRHIEALDEFRQYLDVVPNQPWVIARMGYAYSKMGETDQALEWTRKALRASPSDPELLLEMASRFVDAKKYPAAIAILKRVVAEGGARGEVYLRLGYAHLLTGDLPAAQRELTEAINRAKRVSEWRTRGRARYDLAKLWMKQKNPDNALRQLQMAVDEGFRDQRMFDKDTDLKPLTKLKKYKKMMKKRRGKRSVARPSYSSPFQVNPESGSVFRTEPARGGPKHITF